MMTDDEIIAVVQAHKAGKQIQFRITRGFAASEVWFDCFKNCPPWDFYEHDYRVKPEPREWILRFYSNGLAQVLGGAFVPGEEVKSVEVLD